MSETVPRDPPASSGAEAPSGAAALPPTLIWASVTYVSVLVLTSVALSARATHSPPYESFANPGAAICFFGAGAVLGGLASALHRDVRLAVASFCPLAATGFFAGAHAVGHDTALQQSVAGRALALLLLGLAAAAATAHVRLLLDRLGVRRWPLTPVVLVAVGLVAATLGLLGGRWTVILASDPVLAVHRAPGLARVGRMGFMISAALLALATASLALGLLERDRARGRAVSLLTLLLVLPVVAIGGRAVERLVLASTARRYRGQLASKCRSRLMTVGVGALGYERGRGLPHVLGPDADDGPEHVGAAFAMLVRAGELDPDDLICPASVDAPALMRPRAAFAFADEDVRTSSELSYGWAKRPAAAGADGASPLAADRSVGKPRPTPTPLPGAWTLANHDLYRNVLRRDGSVDVIPIELERLDAATRAALGELNLAEPLAEPR